LEGSGESCRLLDNLLRTTLQKNEFPSKCGTLSQEVIGMRNSLDYDDGSNEKDFTGLSANYKRMGLNQRLLPKIPCSY
jgi:hypothetical protein